MLKFKPVRTVNIQDGVYEQLADAIVSGKIHPGQRLTLEDVASQFSVSIMPVREAFRKLEATKLVKREKNRKIMVSRLSIENIRELYCIRLLLETYAAEKAVSHCTKSTLEILQDLHNKMRHTEDVDTYLARNREFHFTVYETANLPILIEIIESLWERYSPYLYILHRTDKNWKSELLMKNHRGIIEAMTKKDKDKVKYWLNLDLTESHDRIANMVKTRS